MPLPRFCIHARHLAAFALLVAGSTALISASHILGAVAVAQATEPVADSHNMQPLASSQSVSQLSTVTGAVSSGQFEEVVKPTPTPTLVPTVAPTVMPTPQPTAVPQPPARAPKLLESGIASTYGEGDGFEGKRTACGQIFHTGTVQIAHKSLPCGTLVHVVESGTPNSVDARVTDRGPYVPGRIVDLSWAALQQLHPNGPGLLHVDVYVVND